ncbi:MAG: glutamine-hydrolyzing GMP synthase [Treponema sp.]|jgi:GMP synthase (glutamine-hydrolysing)|nr:glutamine-hydrolyzing GMP synthase [Treponema sp.]
MEKILILDFGSQTTQLIGRRIRDLGVYTEIIPGDAPLTDTLLAGVRGIILSGSPESVYIPEAPVPDSRIYTCGIPLLGICYGLQRMTADLGGLVEALPRREYGSAEVQVRLPGAGERLTDQAWRFFAGFDRAIPLARLIAESPGPFSIPSTLTVTAWMSHGDTLTRLAPGFREYGRSSTGFPAVVIHQGEETRPWFGLQFHPEVSHSERGQEILAAFVFGVCTCTASWTMEQYLEQLNRTLVEQIGTSPVLLLISGGVDSTVAGALLLKSLDPEQVHLMYIDTGLMRKDETKTVQTALERLGARHVHIVHGETPFLSALKGVEDPEAKRQVIGDLFITLQEQELTRLGLPDACFLVQGTLYTDLIESGKGVGKKAHLIKSHHNVGTPLVKAKREAGRIIEPLDKLYKDEVRRLGRLLALDEELVCRHPFPGPGLAVRILGEVTREKCDILREADALYIGELKKRRSPRGERLYDEIWQAFAVLLPIRSVGVAGDARKYGWVLSLRAVVSTDGMTADVYPFPIKDLLEISTLITNTVKDIGRVTYDVSSKPPATIEWE